MPQPWKKGYYFSTLKVATFKGCGDIKVAAILLLGLCFLYEKEHCLYLPGCLYCPSGGLGALHTSLWGLYASKRL